MTVAEALPEIDVTFYTTTEDGMHLAPGNIGVLLSTPWAMSETGRAYHAFVVNDGKAVPDQQVRKSACAFALLMGDWNARQRYFQAIRPAVDKAFSASA